MRKALYAGSFDPLTLGHLDIIQRIESLFDEIHIVVANSISKSYLFSVDERVALIKENLNSSKSLKVASSEGLLVNYARAQGIQTIIRGIRAISDFEVEYNMAGMNKQLAPEIETMIIFTKPEFGFVASRLVKEVASHGGDLSNMVPLNVKLALEMKRSKGKL